MSDTHQVQDTLRHHTAIANRMSDVLDEAQMAVSVRYLGMDMVPRYALLELVRVLDAAGLVDDTPIGELA